MYLTLIAIAFSAGSCNMLGLKKDKEAPEIEFFRPASGDSVLAGESFQVIVSVSDNEELDKVEFFDGFNFTAVSGFDGSNSYSIDEMVTVPDYTAAGEIEITVTATDAEGNEFEDSRIINIKEEKVPVEDKTTITVYVPAPPYTPSGSTIEIVGTFNNWPSTLDDNYVMEKIDDETYRISMVIDDAAEFKFRRDGDWAKVECDLGKNDIDNRIFDASQGQNQSFTVLRWIDI